MNGRAMIEGVEILSKDSQIILLRNKLIVEEENGLKIPSQIDKNYILFVKEVPVMFNGPDGKIYCDMESFKELKRSKYKQYIEEYSALTGVYGDIEDISGNSSKMKKMLLPELNILSGTGNFYEMSVYKKLNVFFSYTTPVGFSFSPELRAVTENNWSNTTGKHLNRICEILDADRKNIQKNYNSTLNDMNLTYAAFSFFLAQNFIEVQILKAKEEGKDNKELLKMLENKDKILKEYEQGLLRNLADVWDGGNAGGAPGAQLARDFHERVEYIRAKIKNKDVSLEKKLKEISKNCKTTPQLSF